MTAPAPLDAAVKALQRGIQEQWDGWLTVSVEEAQTLLAVAEAAVEMRRAQGAYFGLHSIGGDACHTSTRLADATAAFDRAAGEGGDRG